MWVFHGDLVESLDLDPLLLDHLTKMSALASIVLDFKVILVPGSVFHTLMTRR